ncbi:TIR domain-containing protein [Shewanella sp. AC91-MNA-CIBAN-0169]|uniref:TIR domain-containing protein n=2 Tax=unclassified Shewanella TaxID=196818 RepID=UPI00332C2CAA
MFDCFVSYKVGADDALAHDFASFLKNDDFTVFIDKKGLLPGTNWANELQQAMHNSNYVLAFFTEDYLARIEHGNNDGQNFIIEELNWALKDKKLIPISVGVPVNVIEEKCSEWVTELNGIQFIHFEDKDSVHFQTILNQLNKLIRIKNKKSPLPSTSSTHVNIHELNSQQAYLKLSMPWPVNEALKYKVELENKFLKESIDYVVLAKFNLLGRFGIKIEPEIAYQYLQKAALTDCREANFELGVLYGFEDTKYGGDEDKATEYYTKAHQAGDIRATYRLAKLFDDNIENSNCPTQFLKNKYGIVDSNEFMNHIFEQSANYTSFNLAEKYSYFLAQLHANKNKEQAIEEIHQLASKGYLDAVYWLGYKYSKNDSEVAQNTQKSLTYLHAGDEQGSTGCRRYLASIYLETEYRTLGFEENIPSGIEMHLQNISLNSFDSAHDLAWVLENRPELQTHISIDEQIDFLEKAVDFGQLNCRGFLAKAYIKTKHLSLGTFAIKSAQQGYFEPTSLLLAKFSKDTDLDGIILEDDYLKLYALVKKEIQAASPKRALNLNIALMNLAMYNNRLQDALDLVELISEENKKEGACYYYAKQVALKGYSYSQRLVFELLKKGAIYTYEVKIIDDKPTGIYRDTCKEKNSARWLLSILLGQVNPCYKNYLESPSYDDSFVDKLLLVSHEISVHESYEYVDDDQKLQTTAIPPVANNNSFVYEIRSRRACEKQLLSSETNKAGLLNAYANLSYNNSIPQSYFLEKSAFDLEIACYNKLFSESKNKSDYTPQSALFIHLTQMSKSENIDNNKSHIEYCFNNIVATLGSEEGDPKVYLDSFQNLCEQFLNAENTNSYEELTNILYSELNKLLFLIVNTYVSPEKFSELMGEMFSGIYCLSANNIQQSALRDKLLFDLGCLYIAIYPDTFISTDIICLNTSSHILVFNLYNKYEDFKFNQITEMEAVPKSIIRMLKVAAEKNRQESENSMFESARELLQGLTTKGAKKSQVEYSNDQNELFQQAKTIVRSREFKQFTKKYN